MKRAAVLPTFRLMLGTLLTLALPAVLPLASAMPDTAPIRTAARSASALSRVAASARHDTGYNSLQSA
ncbi:MAG TPA: hypothetical protein VFU22_10680 [Roseiflexaceae bacterium]|nr:hypothetical protein [Roseiflexaceae bacterium]